LKNVVTESCKICALAAAKQQQARTYLRLNISKVTECVVGYYKALRYSRMKPKDAKKAVKSQKVSRVVTDL